MMNIFKSEFLRHRTWAILAMAAFLAAAVFISRISFFLDPSSEAVAVVSVAQILASLVFGVTQMLLHRRKNHWTFLIHRPAKPQNIYAALMAAGIAVLAVAILVPWIGMVAGLDLASASVVDGRHYAYAIYFFMVCCAAYLVGSLIALSASRGAILFAPLLFELLLPSPDNLMSQFLPAFAMLALLVVLNAVSFKPDLSQHVRRPWVIALMALPMSMIAMYAVSMSSTFTYHVPKFVLGTHPDNNPVDGTFRYYWNLDAAARVAYALEGSDHARASHYSQQATLAETAIVSTSAWPFPYRGQLYVKDHQYALIDNDSNTVWQFSHDSMLLEGRHAVSQQPVGVVGRNGFLEPGARPTDLDRFEEVPIMVNTNLMLTRNALYQVDFADRHLAVKYQPAEGERIIGLPQFEEHFVALATDRSLLLFDLADFADEYSAATPDHIVPHPVDPESVYYVQTYRLVDGFLLVYSGPDLFAFDRPGNVVVHARPGGEAELIHRRSFDTYAHPAWIRHHIEMVSPLMVILHDQLQTLIDPRLTGGKSWNMERLRNYPASIIWLALFLQVAATVAVVVLVRWHRLGRPAAVTWTVLAVLFGVPIVVSFLLMNPWRPADFQKAAVADTNLVTA